MAADGGVQLTQRLIVDLNQCTGCMACALACSFAKFGVFSPECSRIKIIKLEDSGVDAPLFCQQCEQARCMEACPKDAIVRDGETGIIIIDDEVCDGCGICLPSCQYGTISMHRGPSKKARLILKCDLCRGDPQCLAWCETGALQYVSVDEAEGIREAREDMIMAKKRFEIELKTPLWKYYAGKRGAVLPDGGR